MEKQTKKEIKVGVLVIAAFIIFIAAIFVLGRQQNIFGTTFTVQSIFKGVNGLQAGNNVRLNGINIGTVREISLVNDTMVNVQMTIEKNVQKFIRKNSKCVIGSDGLMGDKMVTITAGTAESPEVTENSYLLAEIPVEMDEIVASLKNTAENAEIISSELAAIMYNINNGKGALSMLLRDSTLAQDVSETLDNLNNSSQSLDENLEAAKKSWLLRGAIKRMEKEKKEKREEKKSK